MITLAVEIQVKFSVSGMFVYKFNLTHRKMISNKFLLNNVPL